LLKLLAAMIGEREISLSAISELFLLFVRCCDSAADVSDEEEMTEECCEDFGLSLIEEEGGDCKVREEDFCSSSSNDWRVLSFSLLSPSSSASSS